MNIKKNLFLTLFITISTALVNFSLNKYFVLSLGVDSLGLIRLISQLTVYLALLDLGLSTSATVSFYKPLLYGDKKKISSIFHTVSRFYNRVAVCISIIGILALPVLGYLVEYKDNSFYIYWLIFVIVQSLNFKLMKYTILFLADQKFGFVKLVTGFGLLIEKIIQLVSIIYFESLLLFVMLSFFSVFVKWFYFSRFFVFNYKLSPDLKVYDNDVSSDAKKMIFHKLAYIAVYNTDVLLIAKFLSLSIVGIYSSYLMIVSMVMTIVSVFHQVLDPVIGRIVAQGKQGHAFSLWEHLFRFSFFLSTIICSLLYIFVYPFVILWLGEDFLLPQAILILILLNLAFDILKWPIELFKYKYAYYNDIYVPVLEVLINLIVSIVLIQKYGLLGVVLGTVISNVLIALLLRPFLVFMKCFNKNAFSYLKELLINVMFTLFSLFLVNHLVSTLKIMEYVSISGWVNLVFYALVVFSIIFVVVMVVFLLRKENRTSFLELYKFIFNKDILRIEK
ncbi:lipopolysaccharide biosynthesis protein [Vibrio lentus]|uniref:Polysaccharide biosynthesis protein n=5 Tax=Vibrio lentus TaxID=136468 RepID=A0AA45AB19_9VIBR|nr:hypothetical protein [Vibrio lentus]MCB5361888.1 hypothetical protein [Vibrio lentus]MCB5447652.1 hypothetical protein [Vibrio lentus]MCB5464278.1 hypothetical protein [Vibrio lentus]MCC5485590.1 hypothetical protein [Vibrio lentus]MCC5486461.1 hypothetical protein [Vibrio lentus]